MAEQERPSEMIKKAIQDSHPLLTLERSWRVCGGVGKSVRADNMGDFVGNRHRSSAFSSIITIDERLEHPTEEIHSKPKRRSNPFRTRGAVSGACAGAEEKCAAAW
jgi:hypothetical protein